MIPYVNYVDKMIYVGEQDDEGWVGIVTNMELDQFKETLREYTDEHNRELKHIPLGIEGNGEIVVV